MKRCPDCRRDYYDDTLLFCLDDGTALVDGPASVEEPVTAILSGTPDGGTSQRTSEPGTNLAKPRSRRSTMWLTAAGAVILVLGGGYIAYRFAFHGTRGAEHFRNVELIRITAEGAVESAVISPDGKYIAYSLEESGKRSLWTKHLASESRVQIVPPVESITMYACDFSPDGGYVYFTRQDDQNPKGALFVVPVLGGAPRKIVADVSQPVSISRDGKQIVFGRYKVSGTDDQLLIVDSNGANERLLANVSEPEYLQGSKAAWSPDGKTIAVSYGSIVQGISAPSPVYEMKVSVIAIDDPVFRPLSDRGWANIGSVVWFNDGSGVAFVASENRTGAKQIWQCSFPEGTSRRITSDLNSYDFESLSLTADDRGLVGVQKHPVSQIWIVPEGDSGKAHLLATRKNVQDGQQGIGWTPDGRLVFDSNAGTNSSIWSLSADGSDAKQLTDGTTDDFAPEVSPNGRQIIFGGKRNGFQVWKMDIDGSNQKQLTYGTGAPTFSYSPDGSWIIFNPYLGGIFKMSIDGSEPIKIVPDGALVYPQISPNGELLSYLLSDKDTKRPRINVIRFDNGELLKTFDLPVSATTNYSESLSYRGFHWSPDGKGIVYIDTIAGVSNLWRISLDGGPAKKITDFTSDRIYRFAYAPDGRTIALSRGSETPDAVLIKDAK